MFFETPPSAVYLLWAEFLYGDSLSDKYQINVSIRRTTGFEPFYTTIATVTINLIVAVDIVLLNLYVAVGINCQILQPVWSTHFPDVATSIGAEAAL